MKVLNYNSGDNLEEIIQTLREGKLVVYPTDTVYGIAANINIDNAVKNVYVTKNRSFDKPISICFHDMKQLNDYVLLTENIKSILEKTLPGPYTFLLKKKEDLNPLLTSGMDTVGIRIPNHIVSYELTKEFPVTSTSANISSHIAPDNIIEIKEQLQNNIDMYIDVGTVKNNISSTIIDLTQDKPEIIRKGLCDEKILNDILKINL